MNSALPPGNRGHQSAPSRRPPGHRGALPGANGLVVGVAADRESAATAADAFTVIKHGGFARFWRETPCASASSRKGAER